MITFIPSGNIFLAEVEALVNPVNTVGTSGKGLALAFKHAFPENEKEYRAACKDGKVRTGKMFVTRNPEVIGPKWIINFPTKKDWRYPSKLEWIREGLRALAAEITKRKIRTIALPAIGCGNGGLAWDLVKKEIQSELYGLKVEVLVYEPQG